LLLGILISSVNVLLTNDCTFPSVIVPLAIVKVVEVQLTSDNTGSTGQRTIEVRTLILCAQCQLYLPLRVRLAVPMCLLLHDNCSYLALCVGAKGYVRNVKRLPGSIFV